MGNTRTMFKIQGSSLNKELEMNIKFLWTLLSQLIMVKLGIIHKLLRICEFIFIILYINQFK